MSRLDDCIARVKRCTTVTTTPCNATRDEGQSQCLQDRDDGYRDCCGWIPCKWFCRVWTWIKNIVCILWTWIKNIVCVGWAVIKSIICVAGTVLTSPICLISAKLTRLIDGAVALVRGIFEAVVNVIVSVVEGVIDFVAHPVNAIGTIINFFRGCPSIRSDSANAAEEGHATLTIAHHGYTDVWPENTAQSCNAALSRGADALEIDLCLTGDSQIVVWHDWDPDEVVSLFRQTGTPAGQAYYPSVPSIGSSWRAPVDELALTDFREHYGYVNREDAATRVANDISHGPRDATIPTLGEFLSDLVRDREPLLLLDIKMPLTAAGRAEEMIDRIHASLITAEFPVDRTVLMIPRFGVLAAMRKRAQDQGYGFAFTWDVEFPAGVVLNPIHFSAVDHAVSPFHNTVASVGRPTKATLAPWLTYRRTIEYDIGRWNAVNGDPGGQNAGNRIAMLIAWTLDDEAELRCLVKMGVSGIITNKPELLARILGRPV